MSRLWGLDATGDSTVLEVHVSRLRKKLGDAGPHLIRTVRGAPRPVRRPLGGRRAHVRS